MPKALSKRSVLNIIAGSESKCAGGKNRSQIAPRQPLVAFATPAHGPSTTAQDIIPPFDSFRKCLNGICSVEMELKCQNAFQFHCVPAERIELSSKAYESFVLPLNYAGPTTL